MKNQTWIVGGPECIKHCVRWGQYPDIIIHTLVNEDQDCDVFMPELKTWIISPLYQKTHSAIVGNTEVATHAFFPDVRWHLDIVNNLYNTFPTFQEELARRKKTFQEELAARTNRDDELIPKRN